MQIKNTKTRSGVFYGWWIVLAGFVIMGVDVGIVSNCASQFFKPIAADLGYSRAAVSMTQSIFSMCYMLMSFLAGKIFSRKDLNRLLRIDLFVVCGAYYAYSYCNTLPAFYIVAFVVGVSAALLGVLAFSVIIPNWFIEQRGKAIGLSFMGSGVGGMIFNYLAGQWILQYGWRATYRMLAVCLFVIMAPFVLFVLKTRPSDMGLEPLGSHRAEMLARNGQPQEEEGMPFRQAIRSRSFWTIWLATTSMGVCTYCGMQTISPHLTDIGYDPMFAATMVSLAMGSLAVGKLTLGILYDHIGAKWATLLAALSATCGVTGLLLGRFKPALLLVLVGTCLGSAFGSVAIPIITEGVFGRREYAAIYGTLTGFTSAVGILNPTVANMVFDKTGSYDMCYFFAIALSLLAAFIFTSFFSKLEKKCKF